MVRLTLLLAAALAVAACSDDASNGEKTSPSRARPLVLTTFYPTTYFARRIAGDLAEVRCITPEDEDPATWMPPRDVLAEVQTADLVVLNGAQFEEWPKTASLPADRTVRTALAFRDQWREYPHSAVAHSHGPEGEHTHEGIDGHTWLDPVLATEQARAIYRALAERLPDRKPDLRRNFDRLAGDLERLDEICRGLGGLPELHALYAEHPAYEYVAARYGWKTRNIDVNDPPEQIIGRLLLWEGKPTVEVPGLTNIVFDPCEQPSTGGDYIARMQGNLARLRPAFEPE